MRNVGVPLDKQYEAFSKPVLEYFQRFSSDEPVFDYYRQDLYRATKGILEDYHYPIEPYNIREVDQEKYDAWIEKVPEEFRPFIKPPKTMIVERKVERHYRTLALHGSLRHHRTMELASRFGLLKEERDLYTGHKVAGSDDRYSHLNWQAYINKLFR